MKVLVSGASGFVGSALVRCLAAEKHEVIRLVRAKPQPGELAVQWDPAMGAIDAKGLEGLDVVVHLAGENLDQRWTPDRKAEIRGSRVRGAHLLAKALASLQRPPRVMASASGVNYYGDGGSEALTEKSPPGKGFLADVCREWEAATRPADEQGIRVVHLRQGMILHPEGGALARMLPLFRAGVGGRLGSGRQWMSWIAREDALGAIRHALVTEDLRGAVNAVAPHSVTNAEFTVTLAKVLRRPAVFPVPALALRLAFGEMADETLLVSLRVRPARLLETGYAFGYPELEGALRHLLDGAEEKQKDRGCWAGR